MAGLLVTVLAILLVVWLITFVAKKLSIDPEIVNLLVVVVVVLSVIYLIYSFGVFSNVG